MNRERLMDGQDGWQRERKRESEREGGDNDLRVMERQINRDRPAYGQKD